MEGDTRQLLRRPLPSWLCPIFGINLPGRWGHSGVFFDKRLYIFGGCREGDQFGDVTVLDTEQMTWSTLFVSFRDPGPRDSHTALLYDDKMLVFGGTTGSMKTNDVYVLDLKAFTWTRPMVQGCVPSPRESHTATLINHRHAVIFGGSGVQGLLNDVHVLDCETMSWSSPLIVGYRPVPRDSHTSAVIGNRMYIFGGESRDGSSISDGEVEVLNLETFTWSKLELQDSERKPRTRAGHSAVTIGSKMYIFGGMNRNHEYFNDIWILDVETRTWTEMDIVGRLPMGRFSHVVFLDGEGMVVFGGCAYTRSLNELLYIYLGDKGEEVRRRAELKWFRVARSRQPRFEPVRRTSRRRRTPRRQEIDEDVAWVRYAATRVDWRKEGVIIDKPAPVLTTTTFSNDNNGATGGNCGAELVLEQQTENASNVPVVIVRGTSSEESSLSESEQETNRLTMPSLLPSGRLVPMPWLPPQAHSCCRIPCSTPTTATRTTATPLHTRTLRVPTPPTSSVPPPPPPTPPPTPPPPLPSSTTASSATTTAPRVPATVFRTPREVRAVIDGVFESGYLMTAHLDGETFRGVLFSAPDLSDRRFSAGFMQPSPNLFSNVPPLYPSVPVRGPPATTAMLLPNVPARAPATGSGDEATGLKRKDELVEAGRSLRLAL